MTIAQMSKLMGLTTDTLRYYERVGLIPPVKRNKSGIRDYSEDDIKWIQFVKCMRMSGLSIEVLVGYLQLVQQGDVTLEARKDLLIEEREKLKLRIKEMNDTLERLNYKIDNYEHILKK